MVYPEILAPCQCAKAWKLLILDRRLQTLSCGPELVPACNFLQWMALTFPWGKLYNDPPIASKSQHGQWLLQPQHVLHGVPGRCAWPQWLFGAVGESLHSFPGGMAGACLTRKPFTAIAVYILQTADLRQFSVWGYQRFHITCGPTTSTRSRAVASCKSLQLHPLGHSRGGATLILVVHYSMSNQSLLAPLLWGQPSLINLRPLIVPIPANP